MTVRLYPHPVLPITDEDRCNENTLSSDLHLSSFQCRYTKLVEDWTPHLQYIAWQITKNKQASEDIVQEAFLELWKQRARIIPEKPIGWLKKVVSNLAARYVRHTSMQMRIFNTLSYEKHSFYSEVEEKLIGKEQQALLLDVFNQLPSQQKIVLQLSKEEGFKREEIADRLQLSPFTVKVHLHRAMKYMKEHFTSMLVVAFFFACTHIFFKRSNAKEGPEESYFQTYLYDIKNRKPLPPL